MLLLIGILTLTTFPQSRPISAGFGIVSRRTVLPPEELPAAVQERPFPSRCVTPVGDSACATVSTRLLYSKCSNILAWKAARGDACRCSDEQRKLQNAELGDAPSGSSEAGKRVALLFFGLPRSMPYTYPHIQENVIQVLKQAGYRCAFVHVRSLTLDFLHPGEKEECWAGMM